MAYLILLTGAASPHLIPCQAFLPFLCLWGVVHVPYWKCSGRKQGIVNIVAAFEMPGNVFSDRFPRPPLPIARHPVALIIQRLGDLSVVGFWI